MAQQKKTRSAASTRKTPRKKGRWLWIPKLMLLMACVGLVLFIGAIFVMEEELHRIGLFGHEEEQVGPEEEPATPHSQVLAQPASEKSQAEAVEEVTQEERRELEAILQQVKEK